MGEVAWSAMKNGASVTGYAPRFIREQEMTLLLPEQTLHVTSDLFERKRLMIEHGDAFIALPGGYGTLDEILDVASLAALNVASKPLVLLNMDRFWQPLIDLLAGLHTSGFTDLHPRALVRSTESPAEALALAEALARPSQDPAGVS
jgi:uncharacterized protein (TIGR00730 family)